MLELLHWVLGCKYNVGCLYVLSMIHSNIALQEGVFCSEVLIRIINITFQACDLLKKMFMTTFGLT